jgi:branched-chain amino acid transport system permease protein
VGLLKAVAISVYPEVEILAIYVIVIAVLAVRPAGLFARATA